ncbi:unnamed protein product [Caenorhabditis auriculariae]|uniref:Uncharacterized protein n=1 Tax=Caenorhabditis auriculariae TaxID=2777116 RepID=A0A8S1HC71_9PELO|nr:unnamed protein product [Caenorhabditis auriculariae]
MGGDDESLEPATSSVTSEERFGDVGSVLTIGKVVRSRLQRRGSASARKMVSGLKWCHMVPRSSPGYRLGEVKKVTEVIAILPLFSLCVGPPPD